MTEIFTAKTVEEAKALAVRHFGASPEDITFEILEEPKKGFLGFGTKGEARIRATYMSVSVSMEDQNAEPDVVETVVETPAEEAAAPAVEEQITEEAAEEVSVPETEEIPQIVEVTAESVEETAPEAEEAAAPAEEKEADKMDVSMISGEPSESALGKIERAKNYLAAILEKMGIQAELVVTAGSESAMIDIVAENNGAVIGKRGETLDALQYLTFMIANRGDKEYYRIILNSANYRERRRKTLEELAAKIARNVLRSGRQTALEPMNPYERRIIHSAIAEIEGVSSKSVGEEPYRKVVISSNKPVRRRNRNNNNDRGDRNDRNRRNRNGGSRRNPDAPPTRTSMDFMKTSFEKDYKRPRPEDDLNAGLYGKIEF